jgi:hypothetical protein
MELKIENYYPSGSLLMLFNILISSLLCGQITTYGPLGVGTEPKSQKVVITPNNSRQITSPYFTMWQNVQSVYQLDDLSASVSLTGNKFSRILKIRDFKLNIPAGSSIHGISLNLFGKSDKPLNIDDVAIFLNGPGGVRKGINKANTAWLQKPWMAKDNNQDGKWCYGGQKDLWGANWSHSDLNHPDFGIEIQIRNMFSDPVSVLLNHAEIIVNYTPPYSFCDGKCLTFYVDKFRQAGSYVWHVPDGFEVVSKSVFQQTIDLDIDTAPHGLYEICVDVYDKQGNFAEKHCRPFLFNACTTAGISGQAWMDYNNNGINETTDGKLSGISVALYNSDHDLIATQITDAGGNYAFLDLEDGTYFIKAPGFTDKHFILKQQATQSEISNANGEGSTDIFQLDQNQLLEGIDLGYTPIISIGDFVWEDKNYNGLQDPGESGIRSVQVDLLNDQNEVILSISTDRFGFYTFSNLPANRYYLNFDPGQNYLPTFRKNGFNGQNSVINADNRTDLTSFATAGVYNSNDAGFYNTASVGNFVWEDTNGNGIQDSGESGIAGLEVLLEGLAGDGTQVQQITITDENGHYIFENLKPGLYTIRVYLTGGFQISIYRAGEDPEVDNDAQFRIWRDGFEAFTEPFMLMSGEQNLTLDIGLYRFSKLGDLIWEDLNGNGLFEDGEPGLEGITLMLEGVAGDGSEVTVNTVTDASGAYRFINLKPGQYTISVEVPTGYLWVLPGFGTDGSIDSDFDHITGRLITSIISNTDNSDLDGGLIRTGTLTGFAWEDLNCDEIYTSEEPKINGVRAVLNGVTGQGINVEAMVLADINGFYQFSDLRPGEYSISFETPAGYESGNISGFEVEVLSNNYTEGLNVPYFRRGEIGDRVWNDLNKNGIQDPDEPGVGGIPVVLKGTAGGAEVVYNTFTSPNGFYIFQDLKPGVYHLDFMIPDGLSATIQFAGDNSLQDSDIDDQGMISNIILLSGESLLQFDAGLINVIPDAKGSIGDFVWEDMNGNGLQDIGERGLTNVEVYLNGTTIGGDIVSLFTLSDENGYYLFENLDAGTYTISINPPVVYVFTLRNESDPSLNSDIDPQSGQSEPIQLSQGENRLDIDAGFYSYAIIGDRVWMDLNENGIQDTDEPGISGISFSLRRASDNAIIKTAISGNFGFYAFANVIPGLYYIQADVPDDFRITAAFEAEPNTDSDFYELDGVIRTNNIFVFSNDFLIDFDLGLITATASQGGYVWFDSNNDGIRDNDEAPASEIRVVLYTAEGIASDTALTDISGFYNFEMTEPGDYFIQFSLPAGFNFTIPNQGAAAESDSDVIDLLLGNTGIFTINTGQQRQDIGAGFVRKSSIGDFLWVDANENGLQDFDEAGLNNVRVLLFSEAGTQIAATVSGFNSATGRSGYYNFGNLLYGNYYIRFELPANFEFTFNNTSDNALNSDVTGANGIGTTDIFTVLPGRDRLDIDAGFIVAVPVTGDITGTVWEDVNNNLLRDSDENKIPGVSIQLFNGAGTLIATTVSDSDGGYRFTGLAFGDYYLSVPVLENKVFVLKGGGDESLDSDITNDFGTGTTTLLTIFPGQILENIDFGYANVISIGDFVWDDLNYNGVQDQGEPGLAGIQVDLINFMGQVVRSVQSDNTGGYLFNDIAEGTYSLQFSIPDNYLVTIQNPGLPSVSNKADFSGLVAPAVYSAGTDYLNVDAGFVRAATIGDNVWLDLNGNGIQNANEPGIAGIPVRLFSSDGMLVASTVTSVQEGSSFVGYYNFKGVRPGSYYVQFNIPDIYILSPPNIGDETMDSDITSANGKGTTDIFTVGPGEIRNTIDAGAYLPATLGDFVWDDLNENGIQDVGEPGIVGVVVQLFASTGQLIASTQTDENGFYRFKDLRQRLYYLQFGLLPGYRFTIQNAGNDNEINSDVDATGTTPLISLAHGATFLGVDAGMYLTDDNIVMGRIWMDENENGIREQGEKLIDSVSVFLLDEDQIMYGSSMTNHAGMYCLSSDMRGEFFVKVQPMENNVFTEYGVGNDPLMDNDVFEDGLSDMFVFKDDPALFYVDGGMYYKSFASIKGIVWEDKNNNNILEDTDVRLSDVPVLIFNKARIFIKSAKTEVDGSFILNGLETGEYYCMVPTFDGKSFIFYNSSVPENFSNITNQFGLGTTRLIMLTAGIETTGFHIGYRSESGVNLSENIIDSRVSQIERGFKILPNPAFWYLEFDTPSEIPISYNIFNNAGTEVMKRSEQVGKQWLNIESLPTGRYFIHIRSGDHYMVRSFLKLDY